MQHPVGLTEEWGYEKLTASLRERLSEGEITKLAAEGAAWSEDQAVEMRHSWEHPEASVMVLVVLELPTN